MNTNRLETFADGVFAIAATLLILNVDAQVAEDVPHLGERLLHIWPSYAAYAVTFFTIGIVWVNHHTVMSQIDRAVSSSNARADEVAVLPPYRDDALTADRRYWGAVKLLVEPRLDRDVRDTGWLVLVQEPLSGD